MSQTSRARFARVSSRRKFPVGTGSNATLGLLGQAVFFIDASRSQTFTTEPAFRLLQDATLWIDANLSATV